MATASGQEGHKRHLRELVPIEQCEAVISCVPESCRRCGGLVRPDESQPIGHQVWEVPPIEPTVIEYQLHRGHCDCSGIATLAELPCGVPRKAIWSAIGRLHWAAYGALPPKQAKGV